MDIFQSIILGSIQGLTEFIPVSSSGHLIVLGNILGSSNLHLFIQALDFGTILALLIFFRRQIIDLCKQVLIRHDYRLLRNIIITCLPVATIGLLLAKFIQGNDFFTNSLTVAITMATLGVVMIFLEKTPRLSDVKNSSELTPSRSLIIGLAQCLALVPGTSRSGSTIVAARLMGLKSDQAAEYSFMVSIPVMLGLIGKLLISDLDFIATNWQPIIIGNICAFIVGFVAIKYLLAYLRSHNLKVFGYYRLVLSATIIILIIAGIA